MVIDSVAVRWFRASAVTICPIVFVDPDIHGPFRAKTIKHECVHWRQQLLFGVVGAVVGIAVWVLLSWPPQPKTVAPMGIGAIEGWVAGQLLWRFLYLFCLPIYFNPCRRHWETAAFRAVGVSDDAIERILKGPPYYLK